MEKLNEYLQNLLSSCSDELHLEPDRNPYMVAQDRVVDVSNTPILGTQISMMVFPLIPPDVKATLPHSNEIEFQHPHNLGRFSFTVRKSPSGFIVVIRPMLANSGDESSVASPASAGPEARRPVETVNEFESAPFDTPTSEAAASPVIATSVPTAEPYTVPDLTSSSAGYEYTADVKVETQAVSDLVVEERIDAPAYETVGGVKIEVVPANDPAFATVFSDTSTYEEPGRPYETPTAQWSTPESSTAERGAFANESFADLAEAYNPETAVGGPETPASAFDLGLSDPSRSVARVEELFRQMAELGASDLHMSTSMPPMIRKDGKMQPLNSTDAALGEAAMRTLLTSIMPPKNREEFERRHDTDFAYEIAGLARFRCNIFMDRKGMGGVFRIIPSKILTAQDLGLSKAIMDLCSLSKGLVVVTGPTGSGKSTTLCAMVDHINKDREDHIITIEDPIEFVHENQRCLVNQREVHNHTESFKDALRAALREDPDILLVGEMRDLETISIAIETAETGHLVFGTLHTTTAASTVDRIIDQFPADRQQQIRVMLSESLRGVIAQTLVPKKGGGRVAALEILVITPAISNLIREGKTFQIPSAMQTGKSHGMVVLNDALFDLVQKGLVEPRDAYIKAVDKPNFETMLTRGGFKL